MDLERRILPSTKAEPKAGEVRKIFDPETTVQAASTLNSARIPNVLE